MKLVIGGAIRESVPMWKNMTLFKNGQTGDLPEEEIFSCEGMVDFHLYCAGCCRKERSSM